MFQCRLVLGSECNTTVVTIVTKVYSLALLLAGVSKDEVRVECEDNLSQRTGGQTVSDAALFLHSTTELHYCRLHY